MLGYNGKNAVLPQITDIMIEKLKKALVYMGLSEEEYFKVREPIARDNMRAAEAWSVCTALFWIMSLVMSLNSPAYAACRYVYIGALIISIITLIGTLFFVKRFPWLRNVLINLLLFSVLGAGIGIAVCQPDVRTASMIAFAVIIPTCVISGTLDVIIRHVITVAVYAVIAKNVIVPEIYSWGLLNLIIFSTAGIMIGHVINKARFERYVYAETVKELADMRTRFAYYDQLTGVKNRHAYVEKLEELEKTKPAHFCIIMADLNGLKQTNDSLGHDAGDELILGAAECIGKAFDHIDNIYRIGGDEFCIITDGTKEEAERCAKELNRYTAEWKGTKGSTLSICYGIADGTGMTDINAVIKQADQEMYTSKRNFYMKSGTDRRRR